MSTYNLPHTLKVDSAPPSRRHRRLCYDRRVVPVSRRLHNYAAIEVQPCGLQNVLRTVHPEGLPYSVLNVEPPPVYRMAGLIRLASQECPIRLD